MQLMKDIAVMDKMYQLNLTYFKELSMYLLAGRKKLYEVEHKELAALVDKAKKSRTAGGCAGGKGLGISLQPF